jgi:predicted nucleotidyltransferase
MVEYFLYNTTMQSREEAFENLIKFRLKMEVSLSEDQVKYIWGRRFFKDLEEKELERLSEGENQHISKKIKLAKESISKLKVFNWVRFIGISGSVAAGFVKEDDDIDVFVVVRNSTMWLYRGIVVFRNLFHNKVRAKRHKDVNNKLCLNLICEERGLQFSSDIFNFHELMFLKPIYNKKYKRYILSKNKWLRKEFFVKKELLRSRVIPKKRVFFLICIVNYLAFLAQLLFMKVSKHDPDVKRLKDNYKRGRIEFFDYDFKGEKIKSYLQTQDD